MKFHKIHSMLLDEMSYNMRMLENNIRILEKYTTPIIYLFDDAWKFAQSSIEFSEIAFWRIWSAASKVYYGISILHQRYKAREDLEDPKRTFTADDNLKKESEKLLKLIESTRSSLIELSYSEFDEFIKKRLLDKIKGLLKP